MRPCKFKAARLLAPVFILVLAFQFPHLDRAQAIQQAAPSSSASAASEQAQNGEHTSAVAPSGPAMMSMGSESSSALESSAALAGDDLMAAESSQSPESSVQQPEAKAFTNAQVVRQQVSF